MVFMFQSLLISILRHIIVIIIIIIITIVVVVAVVVIMNDSLTEKAKRVDYNQLSKFCRTPQEIVLKI